MIFDGGEVESKVLEGEQDMSFEEEKRTLNDSEASQYSISQVSNSGCC
jgi:hypothetical protein